MNESGFILKARIIPYLISLTAGLAGFLINNYFFHFSYLGIDLSLPLGYVFALLIALKWGPLISFPAALLSAAFLFNHWDSYSWGTLYAYVAHVSWIPLMGWCRHKEREEDKFRFLTYVVLFVYSLIHGSFFHMIFNPLLSINQPMGGLDKQVLLILSYSDSMTFLSSLNIVRLLMMIPPLNGETRRLRGGRQRKDGFSYIMIIMGALFFIWFFTLVGMAVIEDGITISDLINNGLSDRSLMNNLLYFNLIILTAIVFYQNWEMQNNTARKLTERSDVLTVILENISEGVLVFDEEWHAVFGNKRAIEVGRYSESDMGKKIEDIVFLYTPEGEPIKHKDIIDKLTSWNPLSCLLKTTMGNYRRIQIQVSPLPQGRYGYKYIALIRDTTEDYELEQRNIHTQKQEAIGLLVGGVAHDFNNRLAGIMGFAQLIEEEEERDKIQEYAGLIMESSQAAADLTTQLLTLSRKRPMGQNPLDLGELLEGLLPMLRQTLDKGVKLSFNKEPESIRVKGDKSLLENTIINLALNASHAMKKKGTIFFLLGTMIVDDIYIIKSRASLRPGRYALLKVNDNGPGIHPDVMEKIFDPFFTTKGEGEGTGLGLSTVREIIEKHGGEITSESLPGEGTSFIIILPIIQEESQLL